MTGKVTREEMEDIGHLIRSKWYWPKVLLRSWYGLALVCVILWATIVAIVQGNSEHWVTLVIVWTIIAAIFGWSLLSARRARKKDFVTLNSSLPDQIEVDSDGIRSQTLLGVSSSRPWNTIRSWRTRGTVVLLDVVEGDGFVILPTAELSKSERAALFEVLERRLGASRLR